MRRSWDGYLNEPRCPHLATARPHSQRVYPGLVRASGRSAAGVLLTDLSSEEWEMLDAFEDLHYDLQEVALSTGKQGWTYVWRGGDVQEADWDAEGFRAEHLVEYTARCARIGPRLAAGFPKGE
ncbi:gamma-glutamylcyclotransferase family protein [Streptomyces sp. NPDC001663]|uniref:gamma-glutamylcyclotransferase family protein n=1 Tax=Streptomyces sp. NPDC001663 TaxID=3364597 RepID=UPI0036B297B3